METEHGPLQGRTPSARTTSCERRRRCSRPPVRHWQPRARVLAKGAAAGATSTSSGQPASVIVFAAGFCEDFSPREVSSSLLPRPACFETRCFRGASHTLTGTTTPMGPGTPVGPAHPTQHAALHLPPRTLGSFPDLPRHISPPVSRHHLHQPVTPHQSGRLG